MIASFDIGEVNFAYCIGTPDVIVKLKHFNIKKHSRQTIVESCDAISDILSSENFDGCCKVIIEQQMRTNIRAQRIAQHVWSWFRLLHPRLNPEFVSASIKTERDLTYRQRKKSAVDFLNKKLMDGNDHHHLTYLSELPKKDDVADAFIQLVMFSTKNEKQSNRLSTRNKK
jgi:hypothetical protein